MTNEKIIGSSNGRVAIIITENESLYEHFANFDKNPELNRIEKIFITNLTEALERIAKEKPFAIFLDFSIASIEEIAIFLQQLRANNISAATALIILSKDDFNTELIPMGSEYGVRNIIYFESLAEMLIPISLSILIEVQKPSAMRSLINRIDNAHAKNSLGELDVSALDFYTLFPNEPRACVEFANYCIRRTDWKKAKEVLEKLLKKDKSDLRGINSMVRVLLHNHEIDKATELLNTAEIMSPSNVSRMVLLGNVYRDKGLTSEAKNKYEQALKIIPTHGEAKQSLAITQLSEGLINDALKLFRESSSQEEIASYFNDAAIIATKNKHFDDSKKLYSSALEALDKPTLRAKVIFNIGLNYYKEKHLEKAKEQFIMAAQEDPDYLRARETLQQMGVDISIDGDVGALRAIATLNNDGKSAEALKINPEDLTSEKLDDIVEEKINPIATPPITKGKIIAKEEKSKNWESWSPDAPTKNEDQTQKKSEEPVAKNAHPKFMDDE